MIALVALSAWACSESPGADADPSSLDTRTASRDAGSSEPPIERPLDAARPDAAAGDGCALGSEAVCDDLGDDDCDGYVDCDDPDCAASFPCSGPASELVGHDTAGRLSYAVDDGGNTLVDFSFAGYRGGGVAIPDVPEAGRIAPDGDDDDDSERIRAALAALAALPLDRNGYHGALVLSAGSYEIDSPIDVTTSGVVIRGEGAGRAGTLIIDRQRPSLATTEVHTFRVRGSYLRNAVAASDIVDDAVPVGARTVHVDALGDLAAGADVVVMVRPTAAWVDAIRMTGIWDPASFVFRWERRILEVDVSSRAVTFDRPVTSRIDRGRGFATAVIARVVEDPRVRSIGFEDLTFVSTYRPAQRDASGFPNDQLHAWFAIDLADVADAFVRRTVGFFYRKGLVRIRGQSSARVTIEDAAMIDTIGGDTPATHVGGEKYAFDLSGNETLVQRSYARFARHSFVMNGLRSGNVVLDSLSEEGHLADEPHQTWGHGSLFDNVYSDSMLKLNRVDGHVHGQRAAWSVLWNCVSESSRSWEPEIWLDDAPGGLGRNYAIGCSAIGAGMGIATPSPPPDGRGDPSWLESEGVPVAPRSLYLTQLRDRRGYDAVRAVTSPLQRIGTREEIFDDLRARFGAVAERGSPTELGWMPEHFVW